MHLAYLELSPNRKTRWEVLVGMVQGPSHTIPKNPLESTVVHICFQISGRDFKTELLHNNFVELVE
jgi:hypothetical protein